jgi:hypothetical protein
MNKRLKILIGVVVLVAALFSIVYITFYKNNKSNALNNNISEEINKSTDISNKSESKDSDKANETQNNEDSKPKGNNDVKSQSNGEASQVDKDNSALIEESITSFNMIFKNMVNNKELNIDFLKDVTDKDSKAYSDVKSLIENYRGSNTKIEKMEFSLDKIKKIEENVYQATATTDETISTNNQSKSDKKEIIYKVKLGNGAKIIEVSNLN